MRGRPGLSVGYRVRLNALQVHLEQHEFPDGTARLVRRGYEFDTAVAIQVDRCRDFRLDQIHMQALGSANVLKRSAGLLQ